MHIIVDGYNLIRQSSTLRRYERYSLERGRRALIESMASYRRRHRHRITIVFDGWQGGGETEERDRHQGIEIFYSRLGEKADEVIKRLIEGKNGETLVVSSDRDIAVFAARRGATAISSAEFETVIGRAILQDAGGERPTGEEQERETPDGTKKKGPSRRPSRREKNLRAALRKL